MADREAAYKEVLRLFPELAHWVASCYGVAAQLIFGDTVILSTRGFHQGDPLAALLFSLVLHILIIKIQEEVPSLTANGWYLDDGLIAGSKEDLVSTQRSYLLMGQLLVWSYPQKTLSQETPSPLSGALLAVHQMRTHSAWEST